MIKITHKTIAEVLNTSPGYVRVLLSRHKIQIRDHDFIPLIELILKIRNKREK